MKRVLDKIRFVKTFPKSGGYKDYNAHIGAALELVGSGDLEPRHDIPYQTGFHKAYKGKSEKTALHLTFSGTKSGTAIAIECTPHKLTDDEWEDVRGYLSSIFGGPEVVAKTFRLYEVELAIDLPNPINDFVFIVPRLRKQNAVATLKGRIELGSKQGNRWVRIYDKKKQLQNVKGIQSATPLTRIEFVCRRLPFGLAKCLSMRNPFGEIIVVSRAQIAEIKKSAPTDFGFSHFAGMISKGVSGHAAYWAIEDADMRKAVRKRLAPFALDLAGKKSDWDKWIEAEIAFLKDRFKP